MAELTAKISIRAEDRFSGAAGKAAAAGGKLARRMQGLGGELAALDRRDTAVRKLQSLQGRLGKAGSALDAARRRTALLGRELAAAGDPAAKKLQREFDAARRKSDQLGREHRAQRDGVRSLREELRSAGVDTRRLGDEQRRVADDFAAATRGMQRMEGAADRVAAAQGRLDRSMQRSAQAALIAGELRNIGRGALELARGPLGLARELAAAEGSLARLGMDRAEVEVVTQRGIDLSSEVAGIDPTAFVRAAYDVRSGIGGLDDRGVAELTALASLTARATEAGTEQMTSLLATGFGMFRDKLFADRTNEEFGGIFAAQLTGAVQQFKTTGPKMQQAIESMGSKLANAGIAMEEQFAALGMLQQTGFQPGRAGTAVDAVARSAGAAQERLGDMGLFVRTLDAEGNLLSLPDLLEEMQRGFGERYTTAIGAKIQKAFGSEEAVAFFDALWGQQDAFRAHAAGLRELSREGAAFVRSVVDAGDEGNIDARLDMLEQRWKNIAIQLGEALVPALERAAPWISRIAEGVSGWIERWPGLTAVIMGTTGAFGLFALGVAPVITALFNLGLAIAWVRKQAASASATMATRGIGGGTAGPGRFGRAAETIRNAGRGRIAGAAGTIGGALRKGGVGVLGFLKGKAGLVGAIAGGLAIGGTLLSRKLSAREKAAGVTREAGGIGGALAGAAAGAAIGSAVPVVGTAIGGLAGSIIGGFAGSRAGAVAGRVFEDPAAARIPVVGTAIGGLAGSIIGGFAAAAPAPWRAGSSRIPPPRGFRKLDCAAPRGPPRRPWRHLWPSPQLRRTPVRT